MITLTGAVEPDDREPPEIAFERPTMGWLLRGIEESAFIHASGNCGYDCHYCRDRYKLATQCPKCSRNADEGMDATDYHDFHSYYTDYGEGQGWCTTVQCSRCGTIFEYSDGNL